MKHNLRVFISYSFRDRKAAERVAEALRIQGFEVWSASEIAPGANWAEAIAEALNRSQAIVILISPDFMNSEYAQKEIEFALSGERFYRRVFPVLLKPTAHIPWILERLQVIDATQDMDKAAQQIVSALTRESAEVSKS